MGGDFSLDWGLRLTRSVFQPRLAPGRSERNHFLDGRLGEWMLGSPHSRGSLVWLASIQNWVWNVQEGFIYTSYGFKGPTVISSGKVPARTREATGTFLEK